MTAYEKIKMDELLQHYIEKSQKEVKDIRDVFSENPTLIITQSNMCDKGCTHCIANSTTNGEMMDYDKITSIDEDFYKIFKGVIFGRRGDPMLYNSREKDLADLIDFFTDYGIKQYSIAAGPFLNTPHKITEKLSKLRRERRLDISSMLTFHLYYPFEDLVKVFKKSIDECLQFSYHLKITILGDNFFEETSLEKATKVFAENLDYLLDGIRIIEREDTGGFGIGHKNGYAALHIRFAQNVYPLGRFEQLLNQKGVLEEYTKSFYSKIRKPVVCPDLLELSGLIIEPNGDINLCGAFEAVQSRATVIGNIFDEGYPAIEQKLIQFHEKEREWFLKNLERISSGEVHACKLENNMYGNI